VSEAEELRRQRVLERRFREMGLDAGVLPGGRAVVATLPLGPMPFETPEGPRVLRAVRFYTIGHDRIKCMAPRALFHLPPIRVLDCEKVEDLESRIRSVWAQRVALLRDARQWLDRLGVEVDVPQGAPQWCFSLGLDDSRARAAVIEPGKVILPSRGPLTGLALPDLNERVFQPDAKCRSASDLEIAVTVRLEALARRKRDTGPRRANEEGCDLPAPRTPRGMPLLLVGSQLSGAKALQESLRLRGFEVHCTTSAAASIEAFRTHSFELVLAETRLDRGDGIELVPALRALPGILDLPVVLFDERPSEHRRGAARAAGASGYLSGPLDAARLASALAHLASERRRRRFARFERALSVSWPGCTSPAVTTEVGRGGCLLRGPEPTPARARFALHLPETGKTLHAEAEVVYRLGELTPGPNAGDGLRFCGFDDGDEPAWIEYLAQLEQRSRATEPAA
jgi:two-component system chemotaxis response regulator CheY